MVETPQTLPGITSPTSHVTTLHGVSWETYIRLLDEVGDYRTYRMTYYNRILEIVMPSEVHEIITRLIDWILYTLCEEIGLNLKTIGSTTLKVEKLSSSPEPDNGYYIQNEPLVRGRTIDLTQDPPPDLVVEVNISYTNIDKKAMYQDMKVPEFWSYDGKTQQTSFYVLSSGAYQKLANSATFPFIQQGTIATFIKQCEQAGEMPAKRQFHAWVQQQTRA